MPSYSTILLPPILDYSYPGFDYNQTLKFNIRLSVGNNMTQVDHAQIRFVGLDDNMNALNIETNPAKLYFVSLKGEPWDGNKEDYKAGDIVYYNDFVYRCVYTYDESVTEPVIPTNTDYWERIGSDDSVNIIVDPFVNEKNIFSTDADGTFYPRYYKIQVRLSEAHYDPALGQNVPTDWIDENLVYTSEWSNSATIKSVRKPLVKIDFLYQKDEPVIIEDPYMVYHATYETDDVNETLQSYQYQLYSGETGELLEDSGIVYISEYEVPVIQYSFQYQSINLQTYLVSLRITTESGYSQEVRYQTKVELPSIKLYNSFTIRENEDKAYNRLKISANQVTLVALPNDVNPNNWLQDNTMIALGEGSYTHYRIDEGTVETPHGWKIPYNSFCAQFSFTNYQGKIHLRGKDAVSDEGCLVTVRDSNSDTMKYNVGAVYRPETNETEFILKEEIKSNFKYNIINYYFASLPGDLRQGQDKETYIMFDRTGGNMRFEVNQWATNDFRPNTGGEVIYYGEQ